MRVSLCFTQNDTNDAVSTFADDVKPKLKRMLKKKYIKKKQKAAKNRSQHAMAKMCCATIACMYWRRVGQPVQHETIIDSTAGLTKTSVYEIVVFVTILKNIIRRFYDGVSWIFFLHFHVKLMPLTFAWFYFTPIFNNAVWQKRGGREKESERERRRNIFASNKSLSWVEFGSSSVSWAWNR